MFDKAEEIGLNLLKSLDPHIMKTIVTLDGEPERLWKWYDMVEELIQAHFGG